MKEVATVKKLHGKNATVVIDKKDECSKCGLCMFPKNASSIEVFATNPINAKEGDQVIVECKEKGKMLALTLVFLIPLILILISGVIAYTVIGKEIWMLILSAISIVVWYSILPLIDKALKRSDKFATEILSVIPQKNKENENE